LVFLINYNKRPIPISMGGIVNKAEGTPQEQESPEEKQMHTF
jgi:hypothetical protein